MEDKLGEVRCFAGRGCPKGWKLCDGQEMYIPSNTALFNVLGTTYGGDGVKYFKLPVIGSYQHGIEPIICVDGVDPYK